MSKISFLYIGDVHFGSNKPESRIDNFYETAILKLKEIVDISKEYNVDAILQPGDLFDTPKPSFNVIGDLVNILAPVDKFIMVPGNHEMPGNTESSLERSVLSLLKGIHFIEFTSKENPIFFEKNGVKVAITGSRYTTNIDTTRKDLYVVDNKLGDYHIHLAHGMLSDESMGELIQHTTIDEIMHTKADITLVGHDHLGFGIIERNNKIFVNSGSILRLTCSTKEIKRTPKVVLIEIENSEIKLKEIKLKSGKPGEEVLDRTKLDDKKARDIYKAKLSMFIEEQSSEFDSIAVYELIDSMGESEAIDKTIQEECKDELELIIEELDGQKI
ncbi:MAG: metallophosphoesterase [Romboutsia sp.]|nr:metallophosphoesterase [Romboutsia sp.]